MLCHVIPICHFGPLLAWNGQNDEMVTGCNFFSWNEPRWQNCDCWAHFRGATIFLQVSWPIFELQWPGQNSKMVTLGSIKVQTFLESSDVINARTCHFLQGMERSVRHFCSNEMLSYSYCWHVPTFVILAHFWSLRAKLANYWDSW